MVPRVEGLEGLEEIGRGGFGVVYRAEDRAHGRTVAVKVLRHSLDPGAQARFERECRAAGALSGHPNIVSVHGSGVSEDGDPYLVMDHLPGGSLAERVRAEGPLDVDGAIELGVALAGALQAAHERGIVHRDVKPENVLFSAFGHPQLVDFGIARMASEFETRSGSISASLSHAPPEVLAGAPTGPAADVYSLASTLHHALRGRPPFEGDAEESLAPLIARLTTAPPPDLRPLGVPDAVAAAIEHGLAKAPEDRPPSAAAFGEALRAASVGMGRTPPVMAVDPSPSPGAHDDRTRDLSALGGASAPRRPVEGRRRPMLVAAMVAVAASIGGVVWFVGDDGREPAEVAATGDAPEGESSGALEVTEDPIDDGPLRVGRSYRIVTDDAVSSTATLTNEGDEPIERLWIEVVPKELAARVADVDFSRRPDGIIEDDPVVYWVVALEPGEETEVTWTTPLPVQAEPTAAYLRRVVRLHRSAIADAGPVIERAVAVLEQLTGAQTADPADSIGDDDPAVDEGIVPSEGAEPPSNGSTGPDPGPTPTTTATTSSTTTATTAPRPVTTTEPTTPRPPPLARPGAPSGVVVRSPSYVGGARHTVNVSISWAAPSSGGGSITGYRVRRQQQWSGSCSGASSAWVESSVSGRSVTLGTDTQCGSSWIVWEVAAVNASGIGPWARASGVMPAVVGVDRSFHLVRAVGGKAGGLPEQDCGRPAYTACATSVAAGATIAAGASVGISLQTAG